MNSGDRATEAGSTDVVERLHPWTTAELLMPWYLGEQYALQDLMKDAIAEIERLRLPPEPAAEYEVRGYEYKHHSSWPGHQHVWTQDEFYNGQHAIESRALYVRKQPETKGEQHGS
jgi:hypothetical protein